MQSSNVGVQNKKLCVRVNLISFPGENVFLRCFIGSLKGLRSFAWAARAAIIVDVNTPGDDCECKSALTHASDERRRVVCNYFEPLATN